MLFRLGIQTSDNKIYSNLLVDYPNIDILIDHINDPGGEGYRLTDILSILYPEIIKVNILDSTNEIGPNDSVIRYNLLTE